MGRIVESGIETYLYRLLPPRGAVLKEMEHYAARRKIPIVGPAVGRMLYLLAKLARARRIFEMGSAIGYSAIWLAKAAGPRAEIYYTDGDRENARCAIEYCQRAGVAERVRFLVGDAVALMDTVPGAFDLIFIDVDKHQYPAALRKALPRLRRGGLLLADNTLWHGRVAQKAGDARTRAIQRFNQAIYSSRRLFPVIVPLRDGVAVCRKL